MRWQYSMRTGFLLQEGWVLRLHQAEDSHSNNELGNLSM
ncbi:hypothetical protein BVRB_5g100750 [Beta vulgaris subsp. vulgaris]|nr:hypothetical protein BVRB_5g100750 [Beta vulgaris subsp. vulgaris]